ncbi:hypothetical protein GCM10017764_02860 [Sphingobacterium griseoflavum]|uniref:Uncharacterized protein n=1 Tax=Sphingobacterium griseoflavum TaxID=1474952 RepID=A0ABQ3HSI6_9SPHI|nr:hypothetical protein GCM10017764_02860 [Sphingobacterium griseoflavum]
MRYCPLLESAIANVILQIITFVHISLIFITILLVIIEQFYTYILLELIKIKSYKMSSKCHIKNIIERLYFLLGGNSIIVTY